MSKKSTLAPFPIQDRITLTSGQSLVMNDAREFVHRVHKKTNSLIDRNHIEAFGIFESASPNFVTYFPDVTAEDLKPKDGDYVYPVFRALSEVIVRKNYDPVDFSKNGVLKASMDKLLGQTIYPNHEALIGNELGVVSKVFWDDAYTVDGIKIPAGINFEAKIDGKAHPNIARGVMSNPPTIHSNSVTVNFLWEPSHRKMSPDEFRAKVGTYDEKGELVRRIATEIILYNETSFVPQGADPYAQRINEEGKVVNPKYAKTRDSFTDRDGRERRIYSFSYKLSLTGKDEEQTILEDINLKDKNNKNPNDMNKGLIILLANVAGLTIPAEQAKLSDEDFAAQFDHEDFYEKLAAKKDELEKLKTPDSTLETKVTSLEQEVEGLKSEKEALEKFKAENEANANVGAQAMTDLLSDCKRLYALTGKSNDTMISNLEKADFNALKTFQLTFKEQLEDKFPATCKSCGSNEISMGSAEAEDTPTKKKIPAKGLNSLRENFKARVKSAGNFLSEE